MGRMSLTTVQTLLPSIPLGEATQVEEKMATSESTSSTKVISTSITRSRDKQELKANCKLMSCDFVLVASGGVVVVLKRLAGSGCKTLLERLILD